MNTITFLQFAKLCRKLGDRGVTLLCQRDARFRESHRRALAYAEDIARVRHLATSSKLSLNRLIAITKGQQ
jgi:hypothetical protein